MSTIKLLAIALIACPAFVAHAQDSGELYEADCLPIKIEGRHGPFDYNTATHAERRLVEGTHFNEHYQAYLVGKSKFQKTRDYIIETPAAGFGYTLWAFPNHPFALSAIEDIGTKQKSEKLMGLQLRVHCYFQRAVKFKPNDATVRALYGYYYARRGKQKEAEFQVEKAMELSPDDKSVLSYAAFSYLKINKPDLAAQIAKRAYEAGYQLPGLRRQIERTGRSIE